MQIIWHEDKALVFKSGDSEGDVPCVRIGDESGLNPANLLQKFDNNNILYVLSDDPGRTFEHFLGHTTLVEAAGGTVEDGEGRMLMMLRRGRWDLPKGHVEPGESHEEAALREVAEETGLQQVSIVGPLTTTQHFYRMHGRWETKRGTDCAAKAPRPPYRRPKRRSRRSDGCGNPSCGKEWPAATAR